MQYLHGYTALIASIDRQHWETARLLIKHGADVNAVRNFFLCVYVTNNRGTTVVLKTFGLCYLLDSHHINIAYIPTHLINLNTITIQKGNILPQSNKSNTNYSKNKK